MKRLILTFPSGRNQAILLAGVPRVAEHIRLMNGPLLVVEHILWMEGEGSAPDPTIVIAVREYERLDRGATMGALPRED